MKKYFQICPHCKGEAFKYRREPMEHEEMTIALVEHKGNPKQGDIITCQECDKAIGTNYFTPAYLGVIEEKKACVRDAEYDEACGGCWAVNDEKEKVLTILNDEALIRKAAEQGAEDQRKMLDEKEKKCPHNFIESNMIPVTCRDCGEVLGYPEKSAPQEEI